MGSSPASSTRAARTLVSAPADAPAMQSMTAAPGRSALSAWTAVISAHTAPASNVPSDAPPGSVNARRTVDPSRGAPAPAVCSVMTQPSMASARGRTTTPDLDRADADALASRDGGFPRRADGGEPVGEVRRLSTLSPVLPDRGRDLARRLRLLRNVPGLARPLMQLDFVHYARWTILDALPPADGTGGWTGLRSKYLYF